MCHIGITRRVWFLVAVAVFSASTGCFPHRVGVTSTGAPGYEQCVIHYRIASPIPTIQAHIGPSEAHIHPINHVGTSDDIIPDWTAATLTVAYPHPEGMPDMARLELQLLRFERVKNAVPPPLTERVWQALGDFPYGSGSTGTPQDVRAPVSASETRVLDLPKYEVDLLILELARTGFFDAQHRPTGAAEIEVRIDQGETGKRWTAEPRLEDLVARAYRDGRLHEINGVPAQPIR